MPEYKYLLRYDLQLFANDDKTEEPTAKKIEDTRKEGQVAKSTEISNAFALLFTFLTMKIMMSFLSGRLLGTFHTYWREMHVYSTGDFSTNAAHKIFSNVILYVYVYRIHGPKISDNMESNYKTASAEI